MERNIVIYIPNPKVLKPLFIVVYYMNDRPDPENQQQEPQEVHLVLASDDIGRAYSAFVLALGSSTMGVKCKLYCTMNALNIVKKDGSAKFTMPGAPPLSKYLKDALESGVSVTACGPSKEMLTNMGITPENLEAGVEFEDVIGFLNSALPAAKKGGIVLFI